MYFLYNLLLYLLLFMGLPFFLLALLLKPQWRRGFFQRLGVIPVEVFKKVQGRSCIWLHASSVGEVNSMLPMIPMLKKRYPNIPLLLSVYTATGFAFAKSKKLELEGLIFFPFDLAFICERVVGKIMPSLVIITEAEIWPNFLHVLQRKNIPVIWINGKISSKSFKRYQYIKGFIRRILSSVSLFSVATEDTRQRMIELGIDSRRVVVNGHTKVDQALQTTVGARHAVPLPKSRRIILAASTHAGEEEVICDIFKKISNVGAPLAAPLLILAPRHPERFESVAKLLKKMDLGFRRWSRLNETPLTENEGVLLLDQIGFLAQLYSLADVAFIGGSLIPAGGHNMWEGVVQGVPMVYGPYMNQDYRLAERGGAIRVTNPLELEQQLEMLLNSTEQRDRMKLCMKKFLEEHRGAVEKNLQLVETIYH